MARGRKKNSAQRQELANTRRDKRHAVEEHHMNVSVALNGSPPNNLGKSGRMLWAAICTEQEARVAHGYRPAVTMTNYAEAHQYCLTYDRLEEFGKAIEAEVAKRRTPSGKMMAKNSEGQMSLRQMYQDEMKLRESFIKMGNALGVSKTNMTVVQNNVNLNSNSNRDPDEDLIATNCITVEAE